MIKVRTNIHPHDIKFDPVLGHEDRIVLDGCEKSTSFSWSSTVMPPNHQKITVDCPICESNAIFRSASRSSKQHPVGLGELIPERKFQLLKRGAINI